MSKKSPLNLEQYGDALPGEDRLFGGNNFYVEMIPSNAWYANLRAILLTPLTSCKF